MTSDAHNADSYTEAIIDFVADVEFHWAPDLPGTIRVLLRSSAGYATQLTRPELSFADVAVSRLGLEHHPASLIMSARLAPINFSGNLLEERFVFKLTVEFQNG